MPEGQESTIPIPGVTGNDVTGNQVSPADILRAIAMGQQRPMAHGAITSAPSPTQRSPRPMIPLQPASAGAQGEYATKGGHQRASMQSLSSNLQNTVAIAHNALEQHEQRAIQQKTDAYTRAVSGIQQADEILKNDPTNVEALHTKSRNQEFLQGFLDPTTPEGKKNIKTLMKAYPEAQPEETTPEMQAAQASAKKVKSQQNLVGMSKALQSGSAFPQQMGLSPMTQIMGQGIKEGIIPKAATAGQELTAQTGAAKALQGSEDKQQQLQVKQQMQKERLGLDDKGQPLPIDKLPPSLQAKVAGERADEQYKAAATALAQAKAQVLTDPNSVTNQIALAKTRAMLGFASANQLRAQAMMLNYKAGYLGVGPDNQPLPGAQEMGGAVIPPRLAALADKIYSTQAQFIDIDAGTNNLEAAIKDMTSKGEKLNDPRITKLLSDDHMVREGVSPEVFNNWMDTQVGSTLSGTQRDYLVALRQERERIQGLRKIVGQGVSDSQVNNLLATLPGAKTPDSDYAIKQLNATRGLVNNLKTSVPKLNMPGQSGSGFGQPGAGKSTGWDDIINEVNKK